MKLPDQGSANAIHCSRSSDKQALQHESALCTPEQRTDSPDKTKTPAGHASGVSSQVAIDMEDLLPRQIDISTVQDAGKPHSSMLPQTRLALSAVQAIVKDEQFDMTGVVCQSIDTTASECNHCCSADRAEQQPKSCINSEKAMTNHETLGGECGAKPPLPIQWRPRTQCNQFTEMPPRVGQVPQLGSVRQSYTAVCCGTSTRSKSAPPEQSSGMPYPSRQGPDNVLEPIDGHLLVSPTTAAQQSPSSWDKPSIAISVSHEQSVAESKNTTGKQKHQKTNQEELINSGDSVPVLVLVDSRGLNPLGCQTMGRPRFKGCTAGQSRSRWLQGSAANVRLNCGHKNVQTARGAVAWAFRGAKAQVDPPHLRYGVFSKGNAAQKHEG